jgi:hypothetical protein
VQACGADAGIDGCGERFELHDANTLAGKVRQTFASPSLLHPADIHEEAQTLAVIGPLTPL